MDAQVSIRWNIDHPCQYCGGKTITFEISVIDNILTTYRVEAPNREVLDTALDGDSFPWPSPVSEDVFETRIIEIQQMEAQ